MVLEATVDVKQAPENRNRAIVAFGDNIHIRFGVLSTCTTVFSGIEFDFDKDLDDAKDVYI